MSKAIITQEELNQIIERNWNENLEFLKIIAVQEKTSVETILLDNDISKPKLEDVAEYLGLVAEEKYEFDREKMAMTALCACIGEEILKLTAQKLNEKQNGQET